MPWGYITAAIITMAGLETWPAPRIIVSEQKTVFLYLYDIIGSIAVLIKVYSNSLLLDVLCISLAVQLKPRKKA